MKKNKQILYEYGAMSSKFSLTANNKLIAYATMLIHYGMNPGLVIVYSPDECKEDSWFSVNGKVADRLDELFGGPGSFDKFLDDNKEQIKTCWKTVKRLV